MHNCPCCGNAVYADHLLCTDCTEAVASPTGWASTTTARFPAAAARRAWRTSTSAWSTSADGETHYSDGYVCAEHAVEDGEVYAPAGATVLEFELKEITR